MDLGSKLSAPIGHVDAQACDFPAQGIRLLVAIVLLQEEIVLRCKRVLRTSDLYFDGTNDRASLHRREISLLENVERFGLHRHDDKRPGKGGVNPI
jgi:hypothetical protein